MNNRDAASLWDAIQAIRQIQEFIGQSSYEDYLQSNLLRSAVERQLEILGEATRRMSEDFQQAHPDIDWRNLIGLRNAIAHQYEKVQHDTIWEIVIVRLPGLLKKLEPLLPAAPEE